MRKILVGILTAALLVVGCGPQDAQPEPTPTVTITEEAPAPEAAPAPEPEPESTHDWPSTEAYEVDMLDTTSSVAELLALWSETMTVYSNGGLTDAEFAQLNEQFRISLGSHYDYFIDTTPPQEYEEAQGHILRSLELLNESSLMIDEALAAQDPELLQQAVDLMGEAQAEIQRASNAMPSGAPTI